ncbi:MAG: hypothetical protein QM492_10840 [Rhodobacterales bacterium]
MIRRLIKVVATVVGIVTVIVAFIWAISINTPDYELVGVQGNLKAISIPKEKSKDIDYYHSIIDRECRKGKFCTLAFFADYDSVTYPLDDAALAAQTAQYNRNPSTGFDRLLLIK